MLGWCELREETMLWIEIEGSRDSVRSCGRYVEPTVSIVVERRPTVPCIRTSGTPRRTVVWVLVDDCSCAGRGQGVLIPIVSMSVELVVRGLGRIDARSA